jgi:DegV family protein with EDD domain
LIKIVADTLSCIPIEKANELGISYLPQIIIFGEESYRDDTEITPRKFLEKLKTAKILPKTAAPQPSLYYPIFQKALDEGDSLLVICPSVELSGTYRSAMVAAQDFPGLKIRIIDTKTIGAALGAMVFACLDWVKQGVDGDTIELKIQEMGTREKDYFVVNTLEYLHKGGRIGGAKALIGSIMQVKPILTLRNGKVEPFESQRTSLRALTRLKELVNNECPRSLQAHLCIQHGDAEEKAHTLADQFAKDFNLPAIPVFDLPPAILVHTGPGVVVATFFTATTDRAKQS